MFSNSKLRAQVEAAKLTLRDRLDGLKEMLARPDLDDKLRTEIEETARRVRIQLLAGPTQFMNGEK